MRYQNKTMLDTQTKKRIDDCRDILVGKLPDPKAQIEQITIGLIYKFMDDMDKEAIELGGSAKFFSGDYEKYAWDKLFDTKVTAAEMLRLYSEAIESMEKNPNIPQLFRDIFNNAYLPYRDPETLKLFLKTIGEFEYTHSEKLGDAFEYLLSVMGSQGDAGQFRTPRHIIDFLVAIIDPDKGETILDPACGTAGFLISAYKHILLKYTKKSDSTAVACNGSSIPNNIYGYNKLPDTEKFLLRGDLLTPDNRKKLIQNFAGYDISPDMVRLSLVNLYLHGFSNPHINEYDTLSSEERWNESYDVVLANPPFMSPKGGIRPHKKFTISSNRSEVLFVDYIAEHLNPKGKAGIIVPEGVIFQSGKAYKDLRKMLVENYLYAVVSLPAGVFNPYSGVKTSILLMDKAIAKQRDEILFVKINNDGYNLGAQRTAVKGGQLEEAIQIIHDFTTSESVRPLHATAQPATDNSITHSTIAHLGPKSEIAANGYYNLSGERYKIFDAVNSEFELVELGEITKLYQPKTISQKEMQDNGEFLVYGANGIIGRYNKYNHEDSEVLITCRGATCGTINMSTPESWITGNAMVAQPIEPDKLSKDYLYFVLQHSDLSPTISGAAQPQITRQGLSPFKIPLPPLTIQKEIVAEIEGYQKIIDGAKAVVANYKPKIDIEPDWEMVELQEVCSVTSGGTPDRKNDSYWNGDIPYVKTGEIFFNRIKHAEEFITEEGLKNSSARLISPGTILMAMYGQGITRGRVAILEIEAAINQAVAAISCSEKIDNGFLFYQLMGLYEHLRMISDARGGNQSNLNGKLIKELKIVVPDLEIQRKIVAQIKKEQELVNANKQLIKIFWQKIKDRIAKVWGEDKTEKEQDLEMAAEPGAEYVKN